MPNLAEPTPEEIRAFREAQGLSQAALGEALGSSGRTVEDWEAARRKPPAMLRLALAAIAAKLNPSPEAVKRRAEVEEKLRDAVGLLSQQAAVSLADQTDDERFDWATMMALQATHLAILYAELQSSPHGGFQPPERFEVYQDKAGEYRARYLIGKQVVFSTEGYSDRPSALRAVEIIKKYAPNAPVLRQGDIVHGGHHFYVYTDSRGSWRAAFKYNSEIIFSTDGYSSSMAVVVMIAHLKKGLGTFEVEIA